MKVILIFIIRKVGDTATSAVWRGKETPLMLVNIRVFGLQSKENPAKPAPSKELRHLAKKRC